MVADALTKAGVCLALLLAFFGSQKFTIRLSARKRQADKTTTVLYATARDGRPAALPMAASSRRPTALLEAAMGGQVTGAASSTARHRPAASRSARTSTSTTTPSTTGTLTTRIAKFASC